MESRKAGLQELWPTEEPRGSPESRATQEESVTCAFQEALFCRSGAWRSLPYDTEAATVTLLGPESDKNGAHNY